MLFGRRARGQREVKGDAAPAADPLLFGISVGMHTFMVSFPWRSERPTPAGLVALVTFTAAAHLLAQYYCCFPTQPAASAIQRNGKKGR